MFGGVDKVVASINSVVDEIKILAKNIEEITITEKTEVYAQSQSLGLSVSPDEQEMLKQTIEKIHSIQTIHEAKAEELCAQAHELELLAQRFRLGMSKDTEESKPGVLRDLVNSITAGKEEAQNKLLIIKKYLEPEIKKAQEIITSLEAMKKLVDEKFKGAEVEEALTLKQEIEKEIDELKEELDGYYNKAMLLSYGQRDSVVTSMNELVKSDFKSKAQANTLKILYDISAKLKITPKEVHDEVTAGFELNQMKNEFFDGLSDLIMKPKETVVKGFEKLKSELGINSTEKT